MAPEGEGEDASTNPQRSRMLTHVHMHRSSELQRTHARTEASVTWRQGAVRHRAATAPPQASDPTCMNPGAGWQGGGSISR